MFVIGLCFGALLTAALIGWLGPPKAWVETERAYEVESKRARMHAAAMSLSECVVGDGFGRETRELAFMKARAAYLEALDEFD